MKTKLNAAFNAMSGRLGRLVYCCDKDGNVSWVREYTEQTITEHNHYTGNVGKNLALFKGNVSSLYMGDLKNYADRYNLSDFRKGRYLNGYTILTKMMFALKKAGYPVDLLTVTPQDVIDNAFPVRTLKEAIENELLPRVARYDDLTYWIVE